MYISDTKVYYERLIYYDLSIIEYCVADCIEKIAASGKTGFCFMSKETIANAFNIGVATVYRILKKLESKSIIQRDGELISINEWEGKGNFYYIRHQLIQELSEELNINLSLEEYAIIYISINQPRIKACEVQKRINCSKNSTNRYMKNIAAQHGFLFKSGKIEIIDNKIEEYFASKSIKIHQEKSAKMIAIGV